MKNHSGTSAGQSLHLRLETKCHNKAKLFAALAHPDVYYYYV
jgi:hypothetical protein